MHIQIALKNKYNCTVYSGKLRAICKFIWNQVCQFQVGHSSFVCMYNDTKVILGTFKNYVHHIFRFEDFVDQVIRKTRGESTETKFEYDAVCAYAQLMQI